MNFEEALERVRQPDQTAMAETRRRLDNLLKPLSCLGRLEEHLVQISGMTGSADFDFREKTVVVFCADNGIVRQGVSQTGQEVTALVAENMTKGDACVCAMATTAGAKVLPVDIGIASDQAVTGLRDCKVMRGTRDFSVEPAMTEAEAVRALEVGIGLAEELRERGVGLAAIGEMGIGNTTTASAMAAVLLGVDPKQVTGRGAGLSDEGRRHKAAVIEKAIALHRPDPARPLEVLAKLGGLDIAGMAGFCIGAATCGLPVVLDGVISCVAAVTACEMAEGVGAFLLPSHISAEPACGLLLERLKRTPLLRADMSLGEGSGAVATFPLYDMVLAVYNRMPSFRDAGMAPYERYE